jgi:cytochrome c553
MHSLKAYRSGARENAMMSPMAKPLTDREIKDLAWYFSMQTGLVSKYYRRLHKRLTNTVR